MRFEILPNNNLKFFMERGDKSVIQHLLDRHGPNDGHILADLFDKEGWTGNGQMHLVKPMSIGALTEAPILTDEITYQEDGTEIVLGKTWWYPQYETRCFAEDLLKTGSTVFTYAN